MRTFAIAIALLALAGCPREDPAPKAPSIIPHPVGEPRPPMLRGLIRDDRGRPVAGARVQVLLPSGGGHRGRTEGLLAKTGEDGRFAVDIGGSFDLGVDPPLVIFAGKDGHVPARHEIAAYRRATGLDVEFLLFRAGALTGRVTDPEGAPVEGAFVYALPTGITGLARGGVAFSCASDADGRFRLEHLRPEPMDVGVKVDGRIPAAVGPFAVVADETISVGDLVVRPGATIRGRVETPGGEPIAGALVRAWRSRELREIEIYGRTSVDRAGGSALTDAEGAFAIDGLAPEAYTVETQVPGHRSVESAVTGVQPGTEVRLVLAPETWLELDVFDATTAKPVGKFSLAMDVRTGASRATVMEEVRAGLGYRVPVNVGSVCDLTVSAEGYEVHTRRITVDKAGTHPVAVPMTPR